MTRPSPISRPANDPPMVNDARLNGLVGYNLKRAFNRFQSGLLRVLRPYDLRMLTYTALVLVADNPGLRQSQLAEVMDIERPNLVVIIDELEQKGLITRDRVPTDRRAYALMPTLAGQQLAQAATQAIERMEDGILADLCPDAQSQLIATLGIIRHLDR